MRCACARTPPSSEKIKDPPRGQLIPTHVSAAVKKSAGFEQVRGPRDAPETHRTAQPIGAPTAMPLVVQASSLESAASPWLPVDVEDVARIEEVGRLILSVSTHSLLGRILGDRSSTALTNRLAMACDLIHVGLLVFPKSPDDALDLLHSLGYSLGPVVPSVIVKEQISRRYGLDEATLDVRIVHGGRIARDGQRRELELFMLTPTAGRLVNEIANEERTFERQTHFALRIKEPSVHSLRDVSSMLRVEGALRMEGGGFNPYESADQGGVTVRYFSNPRHDQNDRLFRRLEIQCFGDYPDVPIGMAR